MITGGKIVKFIDGAGNTTAGTVIEIGCLRSGGQKMAKINTIDGKRVLKNLVDLLEVKNTVRGKRSSKVLEEVAASLGKKVIPVPNSPGMGPAKVLYPITPPSKSYTSLTAAADSSLMEEMKKQLKEITVEKNLLQEENTALKQQIDSLQNFASNEEQLKLTICCLADSLQEAVSGLEYDKIVTSLIGCIKKLNKIEP